MKKSMAYIALVFGTLGMPHSAEAVELPAMIEARVPVDPAPVFAKDANHLLYEIIFTNYLPMTVSLSGV